MNVLSLLCRCVLQPALDAVVALPDFVVNVVSLLCRCVPLLAIETVVELAKFAVYVSMLWRCELPPALDAVV